MCRVGIPVEAIASVRAWKQLGAGCVWKQGLHSEWLEEN